MLDGDVLRHLLEWQDLGGVGGGCPGRARLEPEVYLTARVPVHRVDLVWRERWRERVRVRWRERGRERASRERGIERQTGRQTDFAFFLYVFFIFVNTYYLFTFKQGCNQRR